MADFIVPASKPPGWLQTRHRQMFLLSTGLVLAYSMRSNLSVAMVAMTNPKANPKIQTVSWTTAQKGLASSMFFYGYLVGGIPAGLLAARCGPGKPLGLIGGIVCGCVTIVFPLIVTKFGFAWACAFRILLGMGQSFFYPCIYTHLSKWAIPVERGRLLIACHSGSQVGIILTMALGGFLASSSWGWASIFYCSGGCSILWGIVCMLFSVDSPADHQSITDVEKVYIETNILTSSAETKEMKVPWKQIVTSVPFLVLLITQMSQNWGSTTTQTLMPTYLNAVYGVDPEKNGLLTALAYVAMVLVVMITAIAADYITSKQLMATSTARKMWNSMAFYGSGAALLCIALFPMGLTGAVVCLVVGIGLNGGVFGGFLSNHFDLSPNFAGVLMGLTNSLSNVASIIAPTVAGLIVKDESDPHEWRTVFFICSTVFIVGNTIFLCLGSTATQKWNGPVQNEVATSKVPQITVTKF